MSTAGQAELFADFIKAHGLKNTRERHTMLEVIAAIRGHFDADGLHERLTAQGEKISRATVYRTLQLFHAGGLIRETVRAQGKTSYEAVAGREHHDHLICLSCGRLIEFRDERIEELQNKVCESHRFTPTDHWMSIRGYCEACAGKI